MLNLQYYEIIYGNSIYLSIQIALIRQFSDTGDS